ncbi:MAG: hypothetical protein ACRD50_04350 [Candidatus Acidiferrales bacterium]
MKFTPRLSAVRFISVMLLGSFALALSASAADRHHHHGRNNSINEKDIVRDCSDVKISFDDETAVRDEQTITLSPSQVTRIEASSVNDGGIQVYSWDQAGYQISACKAAAQNHKEFLSQITSTFDNGVLSSRGPSDEDSWLVYYIIRVPRQSVPLHFTAENGGIGLRGISADVDAETSNGPISIDDCAGKIRARAENGPIGISGASGDVSAKAENGPVSVYLAGKQWSGAGIEASTQNGPLSLHIPAGYESGVRVVSYGYSPFDCDAPACDQAHGTWKSREHGVEFGQGSPVIRMSTHNGPVSILSD